MPDRVQLKVLRFNPQTDERPHQQTYTVPFSEKMNVLQALEFVYENLDDTLAFRRYCCGLQYCNSCLLVINGTPAHACLTLLASGTEIEIAPLTGKRVLRDLITE
jgi:fumarate reductase iron-sulfur subunit